MGWDNEVQLYSRFLSQFQILLVKFDLVVLLVLILLDKMIIKVGINKLILTKKLI